VEQSGWEGLWERTVELLMWRNVAKSALWFGCGSMFFFSCSCSREITFRHVNSDAIFLPPVPDFCVWPLWWSRTEILLMICSPISALCHLGVMILGLAFFKDSVPQRQDLNTDLICLSNWMIRSGKLSRVCNCVTDRRLRKGGASSWPKKVCFVLLELCFLLQTPWYLRHKWSSRVNPWWLSK
jgi:hypothetical protein